MTIVRRPSPFASSCRSARRWIDCSRTALSGIPSGAASTSWRRSPLDVTSTANSLIVEAPLPGFTPEDVEITVENGTLSIRGEQRQERREGEGESLVQEIRRTAVSRTVSLPSGLEPDKATASFDNGMLTLRIPKADEVKPRQIRISPTVGGSTTSGQDAKQVGNGRGGNASTADTTPVGARSGAGDTSQSGPVGADAMSHGLDRDPRRPVYVISVAASIVAAHPRTLRIYEDEGLICPARTPTNIRLYSDEDIRRITWIRHLTRERGVNLAGIRLLFELEERLGARILEALYDEGTRSAEEAPPRPRPSRPAAPRPPMDGTISDPNQQNPLLPQPRISADHLDTITGDL